MQLDKYIEIKNKSNPEQIFKRLENQFIDIMYPNHFSGNSLVMLLDEGINPNNDEDIVWLKKLLDPVLIEAGEIDYFLIPYSS